LLKSRTGAASTRFSDKENDMTKKQLALVALATVITAAAMGIFAADTKSRPAETKSLEMTGSVKSIDAKARTVVVDTGGATDTFKLASTATIDQQSSHKALSLDQLKVGDRVQLHYSMSGTDRLASKVEVLPVSQASTSSHPKPGTPKTK
jgi:Cu/Ag efflux protein CusF